MQTNTMQKNKQSRGFVLGLALIILGAVLSIGIAISTLLIRDLKLSIASVDSNIAYALADSMLTCAGALDNDFSITTSLGEEKKVFPTNKDLSAFFDTEYRATYNIATLKCLESPIFSGSPLSTDLSSATTTNTLTSTKTVNSVVQQIRSTTTMSYISPFTDSPIYAGGVLTKFEVSGDHLPGKSCITLEVYTASTTGDRMYVSRGKVPCSGPRIIERVVVKVVEG